jgi:hypothetical protein
VNARISLVTCSICGAPVEADNRGMVVVHIATGKRECDTRTADMDGAA